MISKKQIKFIRSLQQKKCRDKNKLYVIEGIKMVNEIIKYRVTDIEQIVYTPNTLSKLSLDNLPRSVEQFTVSESELSSISSLKSPQGAMVVAKQPRQKDLPNFNTQDFSIMLDSIRDPGNLGTIIRIADWFGVKNVVCSTDSVECFNPKVIQSSMGAFLRVSVFYTNLIELLARYKKASELNIYGTSLDGTNLYSTEITAPAILVMGNEANGLSGQIQQKCHKKLYIPSYSGTGETSESLNVSVATGIVCAEFRRRWQ